MVNNPKIYLPGSRPVLVPGQLYRFVDAYGFYHYRKSIDAPGGPLVTHIGDQSRCTPETLCTRFPRNPAYDSVRLAVIQGSKSRTVPVSCNLPFVFLSTETVTESNPDINHVSEKTQYHWFLQGETKVCIDRVMIVTFQDYNEPFDPTGWIEEHV